VRVVVFGATGNVGTSVLESLSAESAVEEIIAVARRPPDRLPAADKARFEAADVTRDNLAPLLSGADALIDLAWLIQPSRDRELMYRVNVDGSGRVWQAAIAAGVRHILYASSVGTYSPGPKDRRVDESWPTAGIGTSFYSCHKAAVERQLDRLEAEHPELRVVRMRPGLIFKGQAADEVRRLFIGPLLPRLVLRRRLVPIVPDLPRLRFQAVHSLDVGDAFRRALLSDARGAFNLAAEPVLGPSELAEILGAHPVRMPAALLRHGADITYRLHLQPSEKGWVDMALGVPLMDTSRAESVLGWKPRRTAVEALRELIDGIGAGSDFPTPPLAARPAVPRA
jgi:UDP-glucose 4-epimerase